MALRAAAGIDSSGNNNVFNANYLHYGLGMLLPNAHGRITEDLDYFLYFTYNIHTYIYLEIVWTEMERATQRIDNHSGAAGCN